MHKQHIKEAGFYFITFTNYRWLPLFEITQSYDLVYQWFSVLEQKGHKVAGYVIMPNHLHVLLYYTPVEPSLNTLVGNAKRFMSYGIIKRLKERQQDELMRKLSDGVSSSDKAKGQRHLVFEHSFDVKKCETMKFVQQKLDYIHANPVSGKWELVKDAADYPHSSCGFYFGNGSKSVSLFHFMEIDAEV